MHITETEQGVAQAIIRSVVDFKRDPWPKVSDSAKDLVKKMLNPDPKQRLTAQEVLGRQSALGYDACLFLLPEHYVFINGRFLLISCRSSLATKCQKGSKCFSG